MNLTTGQTQTILAGREDGVPGNCVQAAIATLLDLPLDAVPHFLLWDDWYAQLHDWLAEQGWSIELRDPGEIPDERCVVVGRSPRGYLHVCVGEHGVVTWDPHPDRTGLDEVRGAWIITRAAD